LVLVRKISLKEVILKYVDNMDSKDEIDGLKNFKCKSLEKIGCFKKNDMKTNLDVKVMPFLKKRHKR
jgi:macrodomain Ter protein organizer (MatP/YcbG family)